jgi:mRNA interferase YafQ
MNPTRNLGMGLKPGATKQFKTDRRRVGKRGWDIAHLERVMKQLAAQQTLPKKYEVHALSSGKYSGHWECHLEPDFLLVWRILERKIRFVRTGSHSDIFGPE